VRHERDSPHEDVDAKTPLSVHISIQGRLGEDNSRHPFGDGEALEGQVLGEFEGQIAEVEDGAEPMYGVA
jgi:hypothetical protein